MTSYSVPPSAREWIDSTILEMWEGRRLLVRAMPGAGKSWFATQLSQSLGASVTIAHGRHFSERNQDELRDSLVRELKEGVAERGSAQLVFDDFDRALRRSRGARLQAQLQSVLIDSPEGRDIGAIFFSRQLSRVHLPVRGSPLVSRLDPAELPPWGADDLEFYRMNGDLQGLTRLIGRSLADLHRFHVGGFAHVVDRLKVDADAILQDLTSESVEALVGARELNSLSPMAQRQVLGLTYLDGEHLRLSEAAREADLGSRVRRTAAWPSDGAGSARAFADLLAGCERALWCDRYLSTDATRLSQFLHDVRRHTECHLNLLMSDSASGLPVDLSGLPAVEAGCPGVTMRVMTRADRSHLHERHLVRLGEGGGWVIPTFDVLTQRAPVGSAVATQAAGFGVDYAEIWDRSTPVAARARRPQRP